jgi:hypothetical protein
LQINANLKLALRRQVKSGGLKQVKGSFRAGVAKPAKKAAKPKKPAAKKAKAASPKKAKAAPKVYPLILGSFALV